LCWFVGVCVEVHLGRGGRGFLTNQLLCHLPRRSSRDFTNTTSDASSPHRLAQVLLHPVPQRPGARFYLLSTWLALTVSDGTVSQSHRQT